MQKKILIFGFFVALTACSTPYQAQGLRGGYSDMKLSQDIYQVSFAGNGYTSSDTVQRYLLYRAAQLTEQSGYKYFVVLNGNQNVSRSSYTTPTTINSSGYATYSGYGNVYGNSQTMINPGQTYTTERYKNTLVMKMLKNNKNFPIALEANVILASMKNQIN